MGCGHNMTGRPAVPSCQDTGWGCNYPVGMAPLELINYDRNLYDLYRTNGGMGQGMIDAFPYDPVVSTGIFASQYQLSEGLAWAYLLRPDAQDNISVGDNLIVPVDTYTNNKAMPPYEKVMIGPGNEEYQTSSYAGSQLEVQADMVAANKGNLPPFAKTFNMSNKYNNRPVPFVGDLSSYFAEEESRILSRTMDASTSPAPAPTGPVLDPSALVGPTMVGTSSPVPSGSSSLTPGSSVVAPTGTGPVQIGTGTSTPSGPTFASAQDNNPGIVVAPGSTTGPASGPSGPAVVVTDAPSLGLGGAGGGAAPADAPAQDPAAEPGAAAPTASCTINWMPIVIGALIGIAGGYYYADQNDKKGLTKIGYTALAALAFGLMGYLYAKHKCTPIAILTKMGIKNESGFCAGCAQMGM